MDNGTFDLTHKKTGKTYSGLHVFADREEIGDLYDHHEFAVPDERRSSGSSKGWQLHEKSEERVVFKHEISWSLPDKAGDKVRSVYEKAVTIVTYATLHAGIDRLDLMTELDNVCEDHMLRVAFETGIRADAVHAYDHFNVVSRAVAKTGAEWRDNPFQEFVDVSDGETGLCLSSIGLPAYEAIQGANGIELQLTLVRSAGKIGPAAGANYPAPGGQSPGSHRFEYALIPHEGDWLQGNCASRAADYRNRMLLAADSLHGGTQPSSSAAITFVSGGDAATPVLSCLKRSEVGDDWIVRLWNPGKGSDIRLNSVSSGARFQRTRLDESAFAEESAESNINYRVTGGDLLTVRVSMKEPPRG
ncbi:glycoside hydrolase family 38 C-terminal domain-containing protein [Cohnella rhizosphaerae]|uniref:Glycosyl hydrolase family 38 C-terminal domain-containing protein n=1 Tax=Cohnella rhizosphaerae TaxID=1457232 RepID=A0A9X4KXY8_9BACL|nr:glycoside hydrolase family 38 C-terminal domain-containing protein [Cohnella rhizosphaerae]MDG0810384.1 hypothetical protein [Cohnella rhizosphaerae]